MRHSSPSIHPPNRRTHPPGEPATPPPDSLGGVPLSSRTSAPPSNRKVPPPKPKRSRRRDRAVKRLGDFIQRLQLLTGVLVVIAAAVLVAWGLRRYLHKSPRFSISTVTVEGTRRLTRKRITQAAGVAPGTNIFQIDEHAAEAKLTSTDPWVDSATIRKELPDTLHVKIVERDPRLLANIGGRLFVIDEKGEPFKELEPGDPTDFPVLTGLRPEELDNDRASAVARIRLALALVADLEDHGVSARFPIQELHLDELGGIAVVAGTEGLSLVFGEPPYRHKVEKAARIFSELRARQVKAESIFLDNRAHPERVVVRMRNDGNSSKNAEKAESSR